MSKNKMDKYTIEQDSHFEEYWNVLKNDKYHCEFVHEKDAQEYIAFKNQKKIDKLVVTQIILPVLHREIRLDKKCEYGGSLCGHKTKEMETAIEIISNLPTGD